MNKNTTEISDLELISCHEAGHAVAQYLLGYSLSGIKVNPIKGYGLFLHDCRPDGELGIPAWRILEIEKNVLVWCAGNAAEYILVGVKEWKRRSGDYAGAVEELASICEGIQETHAYIKLMWIRARNLLKKPQNWHAVKALSNALIWCPMKPNSENYWYDDEMAELLPDDFYESDWELRDMDGKDAEEIIQKALIEYARTHDTNINSGPSSSAEKIRKIL